MHFITNLFLNICRRNRYNPSECSELDFACIHAISSILSCGPVFEASSLSDNGYCYNMLTFLLRADSEEVSWMVG